MGSFDVLISIDICQYILFVKILLNLYVCIAAHLKTTFIGEGAPLGSAVVHIQ